MNYIRSMNFKQRGNLGIFGGFLIYCVFGQVYIWANMCEYVTSYLVNQQHEEINNSTVNVIFPILLFASPLGIQCSLFVSHRFGETRTIFSFAFLLSISIFLSAFARKFWVFALFYGFLSGISIGGMYFIPLKNAQKYFPMRKGTAYGLIICGYGLGSLLFNWLLFLLVNPQNQQAVMNKNNQLLYSSEVSANIPRALIILACTYFVLSMIGSILIIKPSERDLLEVRAAQVSMQSLHNFSQKSTQTITKILENQLNNSGKDTLQQPKPQANNENVDPNNNDKSQLKEINHQAESENKVNAQNTVITWSDIPVSAKEEHRQQKKRDMQISESSDECESLQMAFKQRELYLSVFIACVGSCFGITIASNYKNYGLSYHSSDTYFYVMSSLGSVSNGFSRFFWGMMMDKMSFKRILILNLSIQVILDISLQFVVQNRYIFMIYVILTFFCYGGWYVIMPTHCFHLFGAKFAHQIYIFFAFAFPISGFLQQFIIYQFNWDQVFLINFGFIALGLVVVNVFPLTIDWKQKSLLRSLNSTIKQQSLTDLGSSLSKQQSIPVIKNNYYMMDYEI